MAPGEEEEEEQVTWNVAPALLVNTRDIDVEFSAGLSFSDGGARMNLEVRLGQPMVYPVAESL